jgi:hypothetical protein
MQSYVIFELASFLEELKRFLPMNAAYKKIMHAKAINGYLMNSDNSAPTLIRLNAPYVAVNIPSVPITPLAITQYMPQRLRDKNGTEVYIGHPNLLKVACLLALRAMHCVFCTGIKKS